jgi:hypothetical protein
MLTAIRGTYDGKNFRVQPSEKLPKVAGEVPVAIVFLDPIPDMTEEQQRQFDAMHRMRVRRAEMEPLDFPIKDLIEEGREH